EVLVYVTVTCPGLLKPSEKLVAITPLNKKKKVGFTECATSSSNTRKQFSLGPVPQLMTPGTISSGLRPNHIPQPPYVPPTKNDKDLLFQPMFNDYFNPPLSFVSPVQAAAAPRPVDPASSPSSTTIDQDESSLISTTKQLKTDAIWCYFDAFLTFVKPKNFKEAMLESAWIEAMQEEIHKFEQLEVWELVHYLDHVMLIKLKWIFKVKKDEFRGVLQNKARLVAKEYRQKEGINFKECTGAVDPTLFTRKDPFVLGEGLTYPFESHHTPTSAPSTSQPLVSPTYRRTTRQESVVPQPRSPTQSLIADKAASIGVDVRYGGATTTITSLEAGQGSELMVFYTTLLKKVDSLEIDLKQTTQIYGAAYTKIIKRVKKLEKTAKFSQARRRARIVVFDDEYGHDMKFDYVIDTAEKDVSTAELVSTGGIVVTTDNVAVSTLSPKRNTRVSTADDITMAETLVYIRKSAAKDKGKGKMAESETVQTKTRLQQEEERLSFKAAVRFQADLDEEERQRIEWAKDCESSELAKEPRDKEVDELSQEDLIVLAQGMNVEALQTKYPIIDWEIYTEGTRKYWKIIRVGNHTEGIDIYMLVEKEYPLLRGTLTLMMVAKLLVHQDNEMSKELLRKIFMQAERPRR
nr:integrase, catalytic region, zinc finger, CCHC-type, peptidase aspartic, catalytic [Tanacetum cinerariifolium]